MIAYIDCFSGIAGDMLLGAFLDCGVPIEALQEGLTSLPVEGWDIEATPVLKSGIHALSVRITLHGISDEEELTASQSFPTHQHDAHHENHHHGHPHHEHSHEEGHTHTHNHSHDNAAHHHEPTPDVSKHGHHGHDVHPAHTHDHHHGRSMAEIRDIIERSALSERVKATSLAIFGAIATVEAELHHSTPEDIHFHEIGGVDSLIDICGAAWCLEYLGVDEVYCSALPYSTGYVDCAHGRMPVPAPATLKLLRGAPMFPTGIKGEMITPTGAGIVGTLARSFGDPPPFIPRHVGCGAGKKDWPDRPNLLRLVIGEAISIVQPSNGALKSGSSESGCQAVGNIEAPVLRPNAVDAATPNVAALEWHTLSLIESNIDDMNPELFDHVFTQLFEAGAVDVWLQPVQMKKNRPGATISALCSEPRRDAVLTALLRETTTLGARVSAVQRVALPRKIEFVSTKWGEVRVKSTHWLEGGIERGSPEYDDISRLAAANGVPARAVYQAAMSAFEKEKNNATITALAPSSSGRHSTEARETSQKTREQAQQTQQ
jgi:uncharacterized protein (TIGR00299 family) protein